MASIDEPDLNNPIMIEVFDAKNADKMRFALIARTAKMQKPADNWRCNKVYWCTSF